MAQAAAGAAPAIEGVPQLGLPPCELMTADEVREALRERTGRAAENAGEGGEGGAPLRQPVPLIEMRSYLAHISPVSRP